MHYYPVSLLLMLLGFLTLAALILLVELNIIAFAYEKIGISSRFIFLVLFLSLLGSAVNIPLAKFQATRAMSGTSVEFFGMRYVIPEMRSHGQIILAINLGGGLIPIALSAYLLLKHEIFLNAVIGTAFVAFIVHSLSFPVPGIGIVVPTLVPPLVAAVTALLLSRENTPAVAYVIGTMGTLIGADLLNLHRLQDLQAPVLSIGGAGTGDGIFLTGILAVLLA